MKLMKHTFVLAVMAVALLLTTPVQAAGFEFGVIDMNRVMKTSVAAKAVLKELEGKRIEFQNQIAKEESKLRSAEKEILKQRDSLSKNEFDKQRKSFEKKLVGGQKLVQEKKFLLDKAFNDTMKQLHKKAEAIIGAVAKEKKLQAVLRHDALMLSVPEMDITEAVIARMNKEVKKVSIDWSAAKKAVEKAKKAG